MRTNEPDLVVGACGAMEGARAVGWRWTELRLGRVAFDKAQDHDSSLIGLLHKEILRKGQGQTHFSKLKLQE